MCGIAGIAGKGAVNPRAVKAMTGQLAHRGPDDEGLWTSADGRIVLGHRRLAVLDPSPAGHQPMTDRRGRVAVVHNGEIYNYREVAETLKAMGATFVTGTDTEVILAAWDAWGEACVEHFNGMFAFVVVDEAKGVLFAARDRFGEKPLLFTRHDDFVAFGSEYKAFFTLCDMPLEYDKARIARFVATGAEGLDDGRRTVFSGIEQLLPAERMTLDLKSFEMRIDRYWSPPAAPERYLDHAEAVARARELLTDSVRLRLRADVPVGSCLSGGLDSSAIVGIVRKLLGADADYQTFTGRFPGSGVDEWRFAERVVKAAHTTARVVEPTAETFLDHLPAFAWANELPVASSSQVAQYAVFRLAREHGVTVLLDGQGADELFAGYEQYFAAYRADGGEASEAAIRDRYPAALSMADQAWKKRLPFRRLLARLSGKGSDVAFGLAPAFAGAAGRAKGDWAEARGRGRLHAALARDAFHTHLPTLLRYGDRNSMAHAREVRLPFCDHRLAELAFQCSPETLMGGPATKRLIRAAVEGVVPEAIATRWNKQGFRPPQDAWFAPGGRMLDHARAVIADPAFAQSGLWEPAWWTQTLDRLAAGEGHLAWTVWQPVMVEAWRRHFVAPARALPKHEALLS